MRIGIDLGGTKTEGIVMDAGGNIVLRRRRATPRDQGYEAVLANIQQLVMELEQAAEARCNVGIGTPGSLSARTGRLKNSNTTCLNNQPVKEDLEKLLQRPVRMENDANCFALSEAVDGAGRDFPVVFGVILGTGVGGGIVCHQQLHSGPQHIAGEWGHNVLSEHGPACYCGRRGCVETFLSGPGLVRDFENDGGEAGLDAKTIVARAEAGDEAAERSLQRYLQRFGRAMATVINILDPDAIVLGGGMSNIERLYTEGRSHVARHTFNEELTTKILPNEHGDSAGVRGAAWLWPANDGDS